MQTCHQVCVCSAAGVLPGQAMLQALPCVVAAAVLDPAPGSRVLDLCAAPGGKTTLLAQIMQDQGEVVALDRTAAKAAQVQALVTSMGLTCVAPLVADSTQLYQQDPSKPAGAVAAVAAEVAAGLQTDALRRDDASTWTEQELGEEDAPSRVLAAASMGGPGASVGSQHPKALGSRQLQPGSFDYVLLDAPCSALGLRPRLLLDWTLPRLVKMAAYQRALWHSAVHLLKPGGTMVYCTCTINPGEAHCA
jgi:16S rRNA C967 or C1407 C5-methylase (RsmB/RsmF family)